MLMLAYFIKSLENWSMNRDIWDLDFTPEDPETVAALDLMSELDIPDEVYRSILENADLHIEGRPVEPEELDFLVKSADQHDRRLGLNHPIFNGNHKT
jgi:hypothetical protein